MEDQGGATPELYSVRAAIVFLQSPPQATTKSTPGHP